MVDLLTNLFDGGLIDWFVDRFVDLLIDLLIYLFMDLLTEILIDSYTTIWQIKYFYLSQFDKQNIFIFNNLTSKIFYI